MDPMGAGGTPPQRPRNTDPSFANYQGGYRNDPTPPPQPQQRVTQPPPPPSKGSGGKVAAIVLSVLVVLGLVAGGLWYAGVFKKKSGNSSASGSGEIFLQPAAAVGPDPYSAQPLATQPDPTVASPAAAATTTVAQPSTSVQVVSYSGATPGLYGGTQNVAACDPSLLVTFLMNNRDKAAAWVGALNADPAVKLADGSALSVDTIPQYVATLTPVVLQYDTRVTNHGFANGKATKLQSVLQRGNAVLVDSLGVPRVRCFCGNPLLPPVATKTKPTYKGAVWPGFNPGQVAVLQPASQKITNFTLKNLTTGTTFSRPAGTTGTKDTKTTPTPAPSASSTPSSGTPPTPSGTTSPPPATTKVLAGANFSVTVPNNGWQSQVGGSVGGSNSGSPTVRYAPDLAAYRASFTNNDRKNTAAGFSVINLTGRNTYAAFLAQFNAQNDECPYRRSPFSVGSFSGTRLDQGPCTGGQYKFPLVRKNVFLVVQGPGGSLVSVSIHEPAGTTATENLAINVVSTFTRK